MTHEVALKVKDWYREQYSKFKQCRYCRFGLKTIDFDLDNKYSFVLCTKYHHFLTMKPDYYCVEYLEGGKAWDTDWPAYKREVDIKGEEYAEKLQKESK